MVCVRMKKSQQLKKMQLINRFWSGNFVNLKTWVARQCIVHLKPIETAIRRSFQMETRERDVQHSSGRSGDEPSAAGLGTKAQFDR